MILGDFVRHTLLYNLVAIKKAATATIVVTSPTGITLQMRSDML